jgi:hypothetical protein
MSLLAKVLTDEVTLPWYSSGFPRYMHPDDDIDCCRRRMEGLRLLLIKRGGFNPSTALNILLDPRAQTKERAASWLSTELQRLREAERVLGSAPVLTGSMLSRLTISDLAMTMLQFLEEPPGTNLICLLQELLDVDRHRTRLATEPGDTFIKATIEEARGSLMGMTYGVRKLAKLVAVHPSSISRWRRLAIYRQNVEEQIESHQERLCFLIQEAEEKGLSRTKAVERALAVEDARFSLKKYRAELSKRLSEAKRSSDVRKIWQRHVEHPTNCGDPSREARVIDLFCARIIELEPAIDKTNVLQRFLRAQQGRTPIDTGDTWTFSVGSHVEETGTKAAHQRNEGSAARAPCRA